jgi:splicing factor 3A subunit 3
MPLEFTGEEMYGRYLDLHSMYHTFINLPRNPSRKPPHKRGTPSRAGGAADATEDPSATSAASSAKDDRPMEYITYVQQFTHFHRTPVAVKQTKQYLEYVQALLRYLISFHERTQPLKPVIKLLEAVEDGFEERWAGGEILGWEDRGEGSLPEGTDLIVEGEDLVAFDSPEELLELGVQPLPYAHCVSMHSRNICGPPCSCLWGKQSYLVARTNEGVFIMGRGAAL